MVWQDLKEVMGLAKCIFEKKSVSCFLLQLHKELHKAAGGAFETQMMWLVCWAAEALAFGSHGKFSE